MSDPSPTEKRCTKCGDTKPFDAFFKKGKQGGYRTACKSCTAQYAATYRAANAKVLSEYQKAWRIAHPEAHLKIHRASRAKHADKHRAYSRIYSSAYRAANPDKARESKRASRAANRDTCRAAKHRRRARIKSNGGAGVSSAQLSALRAHQSIFCAYCKFPWIAPLHIDHVIPLKQGGPHEAANIVLACRDCNSEKNARTPEQWTKRWYERLPRPFSCDR